MRLGAQYLLIAALCEFGTASAHAQRTPTAADVRARLHSDIPADVAWAAFDAGTFQIREAAPDLIAILESPPPGAEEERAYLSAVVLDALVQMQGTARFASRRTALPSAATLEPYFARWPVQVLLLMSEPSPGRGAVLERWLRSARSEFEWYAIANLLLSEKAQPGFAADVVQEVRLALVVVVVDSQSGLLGSGSGGGGVADGIGQKPRGFPPHAIYEFERERTAGATLLSIGPRNAYYSRRVVNDFQFEVARLIGRSPTTNDRLDYINAIAGERFHPTLRQETAVSIEWRNERDLRTRVETERQKIASEWERLIRSLTDSGYLTTSESAGLPLPLRIEVHDLRTNRSSALPDVATLPQ